MKWRLILLVILSANSNISLAQNNTAIIKWKQFAGILNSQVDSVSVINFWATWCKPCVAELPGFIQAADSLKDKKVRFVFVSLDFAKDFESRLIPFLQETKLPGTVYLLDEPDFNNWIDKVDPDWQGGIPSTLMLGPMHLQRNFYQGELTPNELLSHITPLIPKP